MIKTALVLLVFVVVDLSGAPQTAGNSDLKPLEGGFAVEIRRNYFFFFPTHLCYGALIDSRWVVFPAKCASYTSRWIWFSRLQVVVGSRVFGTDKVIVHEEFDNKIGHDVALIRLSSAVTLKETGVLPLRLPRTGITFGGDMTLYKRNISSGAIERSTVPIVLNGFFKCLDAPGEVTDDAHICAGNQRTKAVKGDEGSPLVFPDSAGGRIVGVLSYANSEPGPAVYANMPFYSTWILKKLITNI